MCRSKPYPVRDTIFLGILLGMVERLRGQGWRQEFFMEPFQARIENARATRWSIQGLKLDHPLERLPLSVSRVLWKLSLKQILWILISS